MSIYLGNQLIAGDNSSFANQDLSNITATGKALISSLGMPKSGYALSTLAQNTDYTAAESGYFYIQSQVATAPTILYMKNSTAAMDATYVMPSAGGWLNGYIPVAKGDKFSYSVGGSFSAVGFYFVKCKGD